MYFYYLWAIEWETKTENQYTENFANNNKSIRFVYNLTVDDCLSSEQIFFFF